MKSETTTVKKELRAYAIVTLALLAFSTEIYFFRYPNNFTIGGVAGLSVVLGKFLLTPSIWNAILNIALLVLAFFVLGREVGMKTVYSCVFMSLSLYLLERFVPNDLIPHSDPLLDLIVCISLRGVAAGFIFSQGATSGGTDVLAMIFKKKFHMNVGISLTVVDFLVTVTTFFVFDWTTGLYSVVGLVMQGFAIDYVIRKINLCKSVMIITDKGDELADYIHKELHRGATLFRATGSFSGKDKIVLQTVLSNKQAVRLSQYLEEHYPDTFIIVTQADKIIGEGFHYFQ